MRNYLAPSSKTEITPTTSTTITTVGTSRLLPQTISMEASNSTYSSNSAPSTTSKQTSTSNSSSSSSSTKGQWYHNKFPINNPKSLPIGHRRRKPKILTVAVAITRNNFSTDPNECNEIHDVSVDDKIRSLSFHEDHHPSYK